MIDNGLLDEITLVDLTQEGELPKGNIKNKKFY
jgi:hypothetical protein